MSQALYIQNKAVKELGEKADELQKNKEQADKRAAQIALEGQKTLQELMKQQFSGSCDDKVKQAGELVKRSLR